MPAQLIYTELVLLCVCVTASAHVCGDEGTTSSVVVQVPHAFFSSF